MACDDNAFGPVINHGCRAAFDFTLLFEQTILSIAPSALFLLLAPWNYVCLLRGPRKVQPSFLAWWKRCCILVLGALQIVLLVLWVQPSAPATNASVAAAALGLPVALAMGLLSHAQHMRSVRPSTLLNVYLLLSLLCDIVQTRTLWLLHGATAIAGVFTAVVVLKFVVLMTEAVEKRRLLERKHRHATIESTSGVWNKMLFWWVNPLLWKGARTILEPDDLQTIAEKLHGVALEKVHPSVLAGVADQERKYGLFSALLRAFWLPIVSAGFPRLCLLGFTFAQPFLINRTVTFVSQPVTEETQNAGYGLIGAFALVYIGLAVSTGVYTYTMNQVMIMVRGCLVTTIYRRTLALSTHELEESAAVTLMSTDVEQVMLAVEDTHEVWANVAQIGLAVWLLERQVSWACVAPITVSLASVVVSGLLAPLIGTGQMQWNEAVQTRIDVTARTLGQMKELKLLGLTDKLTTLIQKLRTAEIRISTKYRIKLMMILSISQVAPIFAPVVTFALYAIVAAVSSHQSLLSAQAFTSLSLISILSNPIVTLTQSVPIIAAGLGALTRIQEYLSTTPRQERRGLGVPAQSYNNPVESTQASEKPYQLAEEKASEKCGLYAITVENGTFGWDNKAATLQNIHCKFPTSSLTIIIGPVGSGKTTLLRGLLNELPGIEGEIVVHGSSLAFCDQNPFLMHATVQKNIIGESALDFEWYQTVLKACALDIDLALLPHGDQAMVGSNGMTLSRGQKQRIAIARSVYAKASIVLLDDALSGLDRRTERQVFNQIFGKQGLLRQIGSTVVLVTHANYLLPDADQIIVLGSEGRIDSQGSFDSLRSSDGYVQKLSIEGYTATHAEDTTETQAALSTQDDLVRAAETDLKDRQTGEWSVYVYYLQAAGKINSLFFLIYVAVVAFCYNFPNLWVQWWSDANEKSSNANLGLYLGVYVALAVAAMVSLVLACWYLMVRIVSRSAGRLHETVLRTVMRAPLSFFATSSAGAITNRFSQDMRLIDMSLPMAAINTALYAFSCVVQIVIISISSKYMAVTIPFALGVIYLVQKFYLKTSRQLRLLDLEVKSPLYSNFIETLNGLVTIRAFGWSSQLQEQNTRLLDESQKPVYLLYCVQRWLTLVMDMLVASLAIILILLTVLLKGSTSGGAIGVALVNIMTFNQGLTSMIKWYTSLETALGAISRVKKFESETDSEERPSSTLGLVDQEWPPSGIIEFRNVSASYNNGSSLALRDISMSIQAGQKIGICGRTGSGKSSLILSLCQMVDLSGGSIWVDGIDLSTLPRESVRSRFNSITQEPFFIPATVRMNLDFTESLSDDAIIEALQKVHLWDFIEERGGLDAKLVADAWSLGQQQLFCLARALLKKSRILILDEMTSSVDSETDKLMQVVIRTEFADSTIFCIAHRLDTILDFDRIAFLDKGSLIEFDSPTTLLEKGSSAFARLYNGLPDSSL
ncbi:putative ABC transporter [Aspergillus clavatus NRRL 1]|uniref:ABC transporter, putative n=1 Tax=Aspergillus clavatus (strain ATCC 1007 / CBS 513.65 / DSM 816 / NCTC 3887 / NRRL 1 / QM 1276 / 107) TaxID=344612 RepID=A1CMW2_ASPCL|nr:ABC transporter, putative [Aspergillus clavatus NRRL 1]EAW08899.1 ABC transporter, putative [Aspergillus clavatus NRRL 1]